MKVKDSQTYKNYKKPAKRAINKEKKEGK